MPDTNWEIKGVGDLDGDGKADVILRNKVTGQDIGWLMNGLTVSNSAFMPTIADTNWEIKGLGDFDGDGKADVILRNKSTGQNIGWLMNGLTVSTSAFMPTIADTNWEFVGQGIEPDEVTDNVLSVTATAPDASEAGPTPATFRFERTGDTSAAIGFLVARGGTAQESDYSGTGAGASFLVTIPADSRLVDLTITPVQDNLIEGPETVVFTIKPSRYYTVGAPSFATATIADDPTVVQIAATDPNASEIGPDQGVFTVTRTGGNPSSALTVFFAVSGTATNGVDYASLGTSVTIPANEVSATVTVTPIFDGVPEGDESVILTVSPNASYTIGASNAATVTIHEVPIVTVTATDSLASEAPLDLGVFRFARTGSTAAPLSVTYSVSGTATNGVDYLTITSPIVIPAGQAFADLTITPIADGVPESAETVVVTVVDEATYDPGSGPATVTITDTSSACSNGGVLVNGFSHCGAISNPGEVHTWTFTATAGDCIAVHIGENVDAGDFSPWIRLRSPTSVSLGDTWGAGAAVIDDVVAPLTGTYTVLVASADVGHDGRGSYRLTMAHTPGPITVAPGDEGGPLTNGAMHTGEILRGDVDVWTFTATAGDRIAVHIGEMVDNGDFSPWIRLWSPTGATLGDTWGAGAAVIDDAVAPVTGTYLVLVASADVGLDGTGTYRLTMAHTPGPITVSIGDEGGPLTNGAMHTGEILKGDVDVWTFTATAGDRIAVHIGEIVDAGDFSPWIRLWSPTGATLGDTWGAAAAVIDDVVAPVTGTYLVLVASADVGLDGTGTYRLTMAHTPGPITVSIGDEGGPLTNGAMHTGEILRGESMCGRSRPRQATALPYTSVRSSTTATSRRGFDCGVRPENPRRHVGRGRGGDRRCRRAGDRHVSGAGRERRCRPRRHGHLSPDDGPHAGADHGVARR